LIAVACFLRGRAKDLLAPPRNILFDFQNCNNLTYKIIYRLLTPWGRNFSVIWQIFMFTANVEKKRKEMSVSNPRVRIKLPIDPTLFKLCNSLIILPQGVSWCIVTWKPPILSPSVFSVSFPKRPFFWSLEELHLCFHPPLLCRIIFPFFAVSFLRAYVLEFSYIFRTDDFICSN